MSADLDAAAIGNKAVALGLVNDDQVRDALIELDDRRAPAEQLVRLLERKGVLSPLQGAKLLKGDRDGYFLGGYRLLYKIASGSFGRVYRGDDPRTGQVVAIKVLRSKWSQDPKKIELFMREGKVGLSLRHPNIVSTLAVNQDPQTKQYYLVMEFIEGGTLRDIISIRKKLELDEALRVIEECFAGLAYAHTKGLTHRDIKPTNILVTTGGQAKLVDFGLADVTSMEGSGGPGSTGMFLERKGTPAKAKKGDEEADVEVDRTVDYAALEKVTGCKTGDLRSDIFFLGVVLFEVATGEPLMPQTRDVHAKRQAGRYIQVEETLRATGAGLGLPPAVVRLIGKMVAFDPKERFQTPGQAADAIREVRAALGSGGAAFQPAGPTGPTTLFVVEENAKLQDAIREKFKAAGFRVLISIDPEQAVRRYQQQPYHSLIVDAGTVGRQGIDAFAKVQNEAKRQGMEVGAVLILNEDQGNWKSLLPPNTPGSVLVRPVTMRQLVNSIYELTPGLETAEARESAE